MYNDFIMIKNIKWQEHKKINTQCKGKGDNCKLEPDDWKHAIWSFIYRKKTYFITSYLSGSVCKDYFYKNKDKPGESFVFALWEYEPAVYKYNQLVCRITTDHLYTEKDYKKLKKVIRKWKRDKLQPTPIIYEVGEGNYPDKGDPND